VFRYVASFLRSAEAGRPASYAEVRADCENLLDDKRVDIELRPWWAKAKRPLVYLVDETMILNARWENENRTRWANEPLEKSLLNVPAPRGGVAFYEECEEALKDYAAGEHAHRHDLAQCAELLEIFYFCLKLGFKGKHARAPERIDEEAARLFARMPARGRVTREQLFPGTYDHTVRNQEPYPLQQRFWTMVAVLVGLVVIYIVGVRTTWSTLSSDVDKVETELKRPAEPAADAGLE
jgi:type VI protein secretion system component VasF